MQAPRIKQRQGRWRRVLSVLFATGLLLLATTHLISSYTSQNPPNDDSNNHASPVETYQLETLPSRPLKTNAVEFPRIFCMVPTQIRSRETFVTILDLWGKWCDEIVFTVDPKQYCEPGMEASQPEEEVELISSTNGLAIGKIVYLNKLVRKKGNMCYAGGHGKTKCRHIWEKVWRSWVYVSDHYGQGFDYYFKVDDDTFFFVPTMREVIMERAWSAQDHHYFGHRTFPTESQRGLINGALAGFSRHTLNTLVNDVYKQMKHEYGDRTNFKHGQCVDRDGATEEVTTSICVSKLGVLPEALYDSRVLPRRPHVLLWMPRDMLTFSRRDNSSSWFYKNAPRDVGTLLDCCSDRPVGMHFMRLRADLQRVYELIVDPNETGELENVVKDQVPEWEHSPNEQRTQCSVFDQSYIPRSTCAKEARYWLRAKQTWHTRDSSWYAQRLGA
ncbi:hypothetical protein BASA81_005120 [Batrachochytrium salamandrivorans]|nr:hypothetical protein BASA81_005120 [Batrachochytrium salamandrivorans]